MNTIGNTKTYRCTFNYETTFSYGSCLIIESDVFSYP